MPVASIPFDLQPTATFFRAYGVFVDEVGAGSEADRDLFACLDSLQRDTWNKRLLPIGRGGDCFAASFHDRFQVTFRRTTDRDPSSGKPIRAHLYLMTIERTHP